MLASASSQATNVTGTVSYFYTTGNTYYAPTGVIEDVDLHMIVDGIYYYGNNILPVVVTSLDLARRTQNGVVNFHASGNEVIGAF